MRRVSIAVLMLLSAQAWSEDPEPSPILSKERDTILANQLAIIDGANKKMMAALQIPRRDTRLLLHASKRGFPHLARLIEDWQIPNMLPSPFQREAALKGWTLEELNIAPLARSAIDNTIATERCACFELLKALAPTPEAKKLEEQAAELDQKQFGADGNSIRFTEAEYMDLLFGIRALFDQMKDLPKLTSEQLAEEWAASAALSREECNDYAPRLDWHKHWDHEGYILAVSKLYGTTDDGPTIVVSQRGGIFYWYTHVGMGLNAGPQRYEYKLRPNEFSALKKYLASMPPPKEGNEEYHYIVSFETHGRWTTRQHPTSPVENPFDGLFERIIYQSHHLEAPGTRDDGFLKPLPENPNQ